ncbi:MAG TPA: DAK2 domain-containing protein, partial [Thermomicrobiales bacterium]|nr:DAK2 domain-containing protein [Thermomicrobiales bacterium]
ALRRALAAIEAAEIELGRLDAAAGDGDHGAGMARGLRAADAAVRGTTGPARRTFVDGGTAFQDAAGGASGALVGAFLIAIGDALPPDEAIDTPAVAHAFAQGLATLQRLGQAVPGDKTMVDTLSPFVATLTEQAAVGKLLPDAWAAALVSAEAGMRSTAGMVSKRGRASRLGERSRGGQDAGATSMYYLLRAFGEGLT